MRTQLQLQRDPMWQTLFHKLTPIERDFIIEVTSSVRQEEREIFSKSRLPGDKDMIDAARRLSKNAGWSESEDFKSIFSALFAERERCAKIAEEMGNGGIADAIRY